MVFVLLVTYPYEFSKVLGVYSSYDIAEKAKQDAEKLDTSNGYNDFDIEEFMVDSNYKK